jgi:[ribosomal protein S18]-alanine N-acetyltransferase
MNLTPHIRWMIRRDMAEVLDIENLCFQFPWSQDDFIRALKQRPCIGQVAELDGRVAGFMVYELDRTKIKILNFAVMPALQRRGIGRAMAQKLISKLTAQRRKRISLEVRESNLDAQLFWQAMGFQCEAVLPDHYADTAEDAYGFVYRVAAGATSKEKTTA